MNPFQFASSGAAEPSANSTKIVRCESVHANAGGSRPLVQKLMQPIRNGSGSNVAGLSAQAHDCPVLFTLPQVAESQLGALVATESPGQQ